MHSPNGAPLAKPPRVRNVPPGITNWAAAYEALDIAEMAGLDLDDWQRWLLVNMCGLGDDGLWAAFEAAMIVPRQSGKSEVIEARLYVALFSPRWGARLSLYTAHEYKTAREIFLRMTARLDPPEGADPATVADIALRRRVKRVRNANGEEAIELVDGRRLRFLARTGGSGRGFTGDVLVYDEAHAVRADHIAATLPALSARPNPQIIYGAAGPHETSDHQLALRDRALATGTDPDLLYAEWSVPDDADLDDLGAFEAANPAHPHRITTKYLRRERQAMDEEAFARERGCMHGVERRHAPIDADTWAALGADTSEIATGHAFGVDTNPERTHTTIVVAGHTADGRTHVEVVAREPGTAWAVDRAAELATKWRAPVVIDPASAAGTFIAPLATRHNIEAELVTGREMAMACGHFYDLVHEDPPGVVHFTGHEDHTHLSVAVDAGRRRRVGDAWAWHRRDTSADISPLVAATLAVWTIGRAPARQGKKGRSRILA